MSAQAYLTTIEQQTGKTPRQLIANAAEAGFTEASKVGEIVAYFKTEHGLGHGHATALAQTIRNLDTVDLANPDPHASPPGSIGRLWLDGIDSRPF